MAFFGCDRSTYEAIASLIGNMNSWGKGKGEG
jgi:hypothetical protein